MSMATPVTGTFTATGVSDSLSPEKGSRRRRGSTPFNISLWGTFVGTVKLERSFDGGTTWLPKTVGTDASLYTWSAPISMSDEEGEDGVAYRLNCTSFTSGSISYRLSQ